MTIQEFYNKRISKKILFLAILYSVCVLCLSFLIYFNKTEKSLKQEIALIDKVEQKINQSIKISKRIDSIKISRYSDNLFTDRYFETSKKNSEILAAQYIDTLKTKFPDFNIDISNFKREQMQLSFNINLKAEALWNRFVDILNFLEETDYPFVFINSITMSAKDNNKVDIDIKAEIKLFYQ